MGSSAQLSCEGFLACEMKAVVFCVDKDNGGSVYTADVSGDGNGNVFPARGVGRGAEIGDKTPSNDAGVCIEGSNGCSASFGRRPS